MADFSSFTLTEFASILISFASLCLSLYSLHKSRDRYSAEVVAQDMGEDMKGVRTIRATILNLGNKPFAVRTICISSSSSVATEHTDDVRHVHFPALVAYDGFAEGDVFTVNASTARSIPVSLHNGDSDNLDVIEALRNRESKTPNGFDSTEPSLMLVVVLHNHMVLTAPIDPPLGRNPLNAKSFTGALEAWSLFNPFSLAGRSFNGRILGHFYDFSITSKLLSRRSKRVRKPKK